MALTQYPLPKDLLVFQTVVKCGSLCAAAEQLGQTPAFVTKRIQQLELSLGTKLLHRSPRGVVLTENGQLCYERSQDILGACQALLDDLHQLHESPAGQIRIGCSFGFARHCIAPAITELMNIYPDLKIHFELFDRQIDLVRDNIDLDIRINDDIPDHYIARRVMQNQRILCAAPAYLALRGIPQTLQALSEHECLVSRERDQTLGVWTLEGPQGKRTVKVAGHLSSNSGELLLRWALEEKGILLRSEWDVAPLLESGRLCRVLPDYAQSANVWAVYQVPLYSSVKLRVCVDFITRYCQQHFPSLSV